MAEMLGARAVAEPAAYRYADLAGRVAIVTGASQHLGAAMARALGAQGCHVAVVGRRNRAGAETVAQCIQEAGGVAAAFAADLTDESEARLLFEAVAAKLGGVQILVNNAGGWEGRAVALVDMALSDWRRVIADNLDTAFVATRAVAPSMIEAHWGRIVNVSSIFGRVGTPRAAVHYSAAKAALIGFTRQLATELGPHGITVNAIAPGTTPHPAKPLQSPEANAQMALELPLRRLGRPEDQAAAVCFFASEAASWITGVTLDVSGGRVMS